MELRLPALPLSAQKAITDRINYEKNVLILIEKKIEFEYITPFRLKIGHFHLWPGTARWRDYSKNVKGQGIDSFLSAMS